MTPELSAFGQEVLSKQILDWVTDAERNVPYLKGGGRDAFGKRTSELVVTEGWKRLQDFGIQNGYVTYHRQCDIQTLTLFSASWLQGMKQGLENIRELFNS